MTVFNISGGDGKTGRSAPSVEGETPRLRNDGLVGCEVAVPDSGVLGRGTFERSFESGVVRGVQIRFLRLVGGRSGVLPGGERLGVLGLNLRKTNSTRRAEFYVGTGGEAGRGLAVVAKKKKGRLHTPRGNQGGEPVADLVLEGWNKGAGEGGKNIGRPRRRSKSDRGRTRPMTRWRRGSSAAVGEHSIS